MFWSKMAERERELESSTKSSDNGVALKVILLGVSGVGKTSLFLRIIENKFYKDTSDKRVDCSTHHITVNGKTVQMYLCDTAGMESLHKRNLTRSYYLECQVALLVYSADDMDSVDDLKDYVDDVVSHSPGAKKFLVRNKIDLEDQSVIEKDVDEKFKKDGYPFAPEWQFKTSASTGEGIKNLLEEIGKVLLKQGKSFKTDEKNSFQVYRPKQKPRKSRSSSCCN